MQPTDDRIWTKQFVLLLICNFILFLHVHVTGTTLPAYAKEAFGSDDFLIGILTMVVGVASVSTRIFVPKLLQRGRFMLFLAFGLGAMMLVTVGMYFVSSILMLILLRVGFGFSLGIVSTLFPTAVSHSLAARRMGEGMGYFGLSNSMASSLGPLFGFFLLGQFGYMGYVTVCLLSLLCIVPLLVTIGPISLQEQPVSGAKKAERSRAGKFETILIVPSLLNFLFMISFGGLITFLAVYGRQIGVENTGLFFLIQALMALMVRPLSGKMFDRFGHKSVITPGAILIFSGMMVLSFATSPTVFLVSAFLYGMGYGTLQPSMQAWMITMVRPENRSMANGMFLNSLDLGIALGGLLLGVVATAIGYAQMFRFCAWLMIAFLVLYFFYSIRNPFEVASSAKAYQEATGHNESGLGG